MSHLLFVCQSFDVIEILKQNQLMLPCYSFCFSKTTIRTNFIVVASGGARNSPTVMLNYLQHFSLPIALNPSCATHWPLKKTVALLVKKYSQSCLFVFTNKVAAVKEDLSFGEVELRLLGEQFDDRKKYQRGDVKRNDWLWIQPKCGHDDAYIAVKSLLTLQYLRIVSSNIKFVVFIVSERLLHRNSRARMRGWSSGTAQLCTTNMADVGWQKRGKSIVNPVRRHRG